MGLARLSDKPRWISAFDALYLNYEEYGAPIRSSNIPQPTGGAERDSGDLISLGGRPLFQRDSWRSVGHLEAA
jgi:hypothetical protein